LASVTKTDGGRWKAYVARKGVRKSQTFDTKRAAADWAAHEEHLILNKETVQGNMRLSAVFERYGREVSVNNRGHRWEALRLAKMGREKIGSVLMRDLSSTDVASWRDRRLQDVAPASVAREMGLMSSVLNVARKEWGLIRHNPVEDVRTPRKPPPRTRTVTQPELEALQLSAGDDLGNTTARAFHAFLFACETAMRAGEIIGLTWDRIYIDRRFLHLPMTKNGHPRDVPLSSEAVRLLLALPSEVDPVFGLNSASLDALWRKLRARAAVDGLRFHDSRRVGTVRLSKKLQPLELAKVTGHRDLNMLLNTYYKADVSDIASKLD
jgi:integrase